MPYFVGSRQLLVRDQLKDISFPLWILYPSDVPAQATPFGPYTLNVASNAPVRAGKFPLVVLSHGGGSTFMVYRTLAAHLAEHGYIVVMPEHYGDNRNNRSWDGLLDNLESRPRHISLAIDTVTADPGFRDHADTSRLALIGHSMGGYTSLAVAGGQPYWSPDRAIAVTPDPRVKALVLLAPASCWFVPNEALRRVTVPILMLTAEHDQVTFAWQAHLVMNGVADRQRVSWKEVKNASHHSFLSPFPSAMQNPNFLPSVDPEGFDREEFHVQLNADVLNFLNKELTTHAENHSAHLV